MSPKTIGEVARTLDLSIDTIRYYERCGVLPPIRRTASGIRVYSEKDISRLRFVQRAQKMKFTLGEIGELLKLRDNPRFVRKEVRALAARKLGEIESTLSELETLRGELTLLINLCEGAGAGCPILDGIEKTA